MASLPSITCKQALSNTHVLLQSPWTARQYSAAGGGAAQLYLHMGLAHMRPLAATATGCNIVTVNWQLAAAGLKTWVSRTCASQQPGGT